MVDIETRVYIYIFSYIFLIGDTDLLIDKYLRDALKLLTLRNSGRSIFFIVEDKSTCALLFTCVFLYLNVEKFSKLSLFPRYHEYFYTI